MVAGLFISLKRRARRVFFFPSGAGREDLFISLRRRALAPLAWLTRLAARRRGRAGRAASRPGPVHLSHPLRRRALVCSYPSGAGRSLRTFVSFPQSPARSRRPGRFASRFSSHPVSGVLPGARLPPCVARVGLKTVDPAAARRLNVRECAAPDMRLGPGGRVAMQRTANPCTPVRFRPRPPLSRRSGGYPLSAAAPAWGVERVAQAPRPRRAGRTVPAAPCRRRPSPILLRRESRSW